MKKILFLTKFVVCFLWFLVSAADAIGSTPPGPQLPPLSYTPADRLRGAVLVNGNYEDPTIRFWRQVEEFPKWGGNVFAITLRTAENGVAILHDRPLTERLAKSLESYTTIIEWSLQHNMHIIFRFVQRNTAGGGPLTWPDDGRSIWKDASAQDELIQAWADLAKRFKGKKGIMFVPITEPHGELPDEFANADALTKAVWNTLYPRLINAIRAEDPERWIIVEPIWGNVDNLAALTVSSAPKLIYSFHFYEPHFFTGQGTSGNPPAQSVVYPGVTQDGPFRPETFYDKSVLEQRLLLAVNFRNAHNVRVMCGEFGTQNLAPMDSRERWVTDVVDLLETYGFDWVYWYYNVIRPIPPPGDWYFQRTAYESVITLKFSLNLEYGDFDASGSLLLAGGIEKTGLSRGPAFQLFNTAGALQTTRFALNPDFRSELSFVLGNFDADGANEVLVGGRETSGLARGPAYQLFETVGTFKLTRFVLNPDFSYVTFSPLNVGSNGVLVCGREIDGLARGPAYQAFDANGNLVHTQFVLNPDFVLRACMASNLDGVGGDEVIVLGRELGGLERGLAIQGFGPTGSLLFTRFITNGSLAETGLTTVDVGNGSKNIVIYAREFFTNSRGPAFQVFDSGGNLLLVKFVLNPDFTAFQVFGANTTNSISGQEIVTGGLETGGLARGPMYQVWNKNGNLLLSRFVLNPDFTEVTFSKIDINNDGLDEILVVGKETKGLARGPAFQLFDGNGNLLVTQFVLNRDFSNLKAFAIDQNGDGDKEIGIGGIETSGLKRGPAYQIFESNGALLQTQFVLSPVDLLVKNVSVDFDGDGKSDIGVYRDGNWFIQRSSDSGVTAIGFGGLPGDITIPGDYDGDGKTDIAVYRGGGWFILRSSDGGMTALGFGGLAQDVPVPADYDGDGKVDIAIYRGGGWFILRSSDGGVTTVGFGGLPQDIPVPGDYDGDGKADVALYRDGNWFIRRSSDGGATAVAFGGLAGDIAVPGDYDGDGKTDVAIYRDGTWFIIRSSDGGVTGIGWGGLPQDIPLN